MTQQQEKISFNTAIPARRFLLPYILLALHNLGGKGSKKEVVKELNKLFDIPDEVLYKLTPKKANKFLSEVGFARQFLVYTQYLLEKTISGYNVWELSEKGKKVIGALQTEKEYVADFMNDTYAESQEIYSQKRKQKQNVRKDQDIDNFELSQEQIIENKIEQEEEEKKELEEQEILNIIKNMDVYGFERLCGRLFKAVGYEEVEVTKASGDGGIDGYGFLVFGLIRFKVVFQAKRYRDIKISVDAIKLLNQSKQDAGAEKAVFITTTYFTKEARNTANNLDVALINGDELIQLLKEHRIGYIETLEFDKRFFDDI